MPGDDGATPLQESMKQDLLAHQQTCKPRALFGITTRPNNMLLDFNVCFLLLDITCALIYTDQPIYGLSAANRI